MWPKESEKKVKVSVQENKDIELKIKDFFLSESVLSKVDDRRAKLMENGNLGYNFLQIPLLKTRLKFSHFLFSRSGI